RRRRPRSTLLPYTTLFRSDLGRMAVRRGHRGRLQAGGQHRPVDQQAEAEQQDGDEARHGTSLKDETARRVWQQMAPWSVCLISLDRKSTRLNSSHVKISYA